MLRILLIRILCLLPVWAFLLSHCAAPRPPHPARQVVPLTRTLVLSDTLLLGKPSQAKGVRGQLRAESRMKGAAFSDGRQAFTIGLVDVNGDGRFTDPNEDWVLLTHAGNRTVRINSEYGTPHCAASAQVVLEIDSALYLLSDVRDGGEQVNITPLKGEEPKWNGSHRRLRLNTHVPPAVLKTYTKGDFDLNTLMHKGKYIYLYFWVSNPLEYQVRILDDLFQRHADRLSIVGSHVKEHDWDAQAHADNFFAMMAKPWPQTACDPAFYLNLHQDYSWYRGVLADEHGRILFPHISPKELRDWLER